MQNGLLEVSGYLASGLQSHLLELPGTYQAVSNLGRHLISELAPEVLPSGLLELSGHLSSGSSPAIVLLCYRVMASSSFHGGFPKQNLNVIVFLLSCYRAPRGTRQVAYGMVGHLTSKVRVHPKWHTGYRVVVLLPFLHY